ncbi:MAG: DegV family protein [Metamycoplasmataceae bacterium]
MKIAFVVDSSCAFTKTQAEKIGLHYLPLYVKINDKDYKDGVDLTFEEFKDKLKFNSNIFTSFTPIGEAKIILSDLASKYDHVIVYPISMALSSQYNNLQSLVIQDKLDNVHIIESKNICFGLMDSLLKVKVRLEKEEISVNEAIEILNNPGTYNNLDTFLIPKTTDALLKGGRLSPSAAKIAKLLKIVPVIKFEYETGTLNKYEKGRIFTRTFLNLFKEFYEEHSKKSSAKDKLYFIYFDVECSDVDEFMTKIDEITKNDPNFILIKSNIPPIIAVHTGFESAAMQFSRNSEELKKFFDLIKD